MAQEYVDQLPAEMQDLAGKLDAMRTHGIQKEPMRLEDIFRGDSYASLRTGLMEKGSATFRTKEGKEHFVAADFDTQGNVFALAAAVPRQPGRSENFLREVQDFTDSTMERTEKIKLFRRIYRAEGLVNNACNKLASLVSTEGSFKVRYVKGQRGKGSDKRVEEFRKLLQFWAENVNARALDAVVTGARGVNAVIAQGVRQALVEGDNIARTNWTAASVPVLGGQSFSLPMNIQFFSAANIEIPEELVGTGIELMYWKPAAEFIQKLSRPEDPNVKQYIDKLIPSEVQSALIKDGRYLLDPALMIHIKNRGTGTEAFGESVISSAMADIAYKRALQALDIVTIENLINRLVIVKVGSDDPNSVYHRQEVSAARIGMLQRMFNNIGPASTILWAGPDIDVVEVGAHGKILEMDDRYRLAESRIRNALGVPSALLTGEGADGKAAGWAAVSGVAAQLRELQDQYAQMLKTLAERIGAENGFEDVDVVWEFHQNLLANKEENAGIALKAFQSGLYSTQTALEELGKSYEAEEMRQLEDVSRKYRDEAFGPPKAAVTTNPSGTGGGGGGDGRPTNPERPDGDRDPRRDKESGDPEENS